MIDFARSATDPTRRLYPHQIDTDSQERHEVWLCGGCAARVAPRRSHTRAGGTHVLAHFATWPRANGDPTPHDGTCAFLPPARAPRPTTDGQSSRLEPTDDNTTTWVLAPAAPTTWADDRANDGPGQPPARVDGSPGLAPTRRPGSTAPARSTITGAHRILDLLRHFDDQPLKMLTFTATWMPGHGQPPTELTWGNLYYPPGRHHLLLRQAHDDRLPEHPVAVAGPIEKITRTANRRRQEDDLSIFLRLGSAGALDRLVLRGPPGLMPHDPQPTSILLALATWTVFTPTTRSTTDTGPPATYCTAWITAPGQVITLSETDPYD